MHNKIFHASHLRRLHRRPKRGKRKSEMINGRILGNSPQTCGRCFNLWLMSWTNVSKYGLPTSLVQPWSQLNPYHCVCVQQPPHLQIISTFNVGFMNRATFCTTDFLSSFPMYDAVTLRRVVIWLSKIFHLWIMLSLKSGGIEVKAHCRASFVRSLIQTEW